MLPTIRQEVSHCCRARHHHRILKRGGSPDTHSRLISQRSCDLVAVHFYSVAHRRRYEDLVRFLNPIARIKPEAPAFGTHDRSFLVWLLMQGRKKSGDRGQRMSRRSRGGGRTDTTRLPSGEFPHV